MRIDWPFATRSKFVRLLTVTTRLEERTGKLEKTLAEWAEKLNSDKAKTAERIDGVQNLLDEIVERHAKYRDWICSNNEVIRNDFATIAHNTEEIEKWRAELTTLAADLTQRFENFREQTRSEQKHIIRPGKWSQARELLQQ